MCCGEEIQTTAFTRMIHEQLLEEIQTTATTTRRNPDHSFYQNDP
jgi:hypothetical protein